jgi:small subunit ribosomal protein S6
VARYENIIIISPDCTKEEEEEFLKRITTNIERLKSTLISLDDWGIRELAYPIKKKEKGRYFFLLLDMEKGKVSAFGRFYKTMDLVLRHMFVAVDEEKKVPAKPPEHVVFDELEGEYS